MESQKMQLIATLYPHQTEAVNWMCKQETTYGGGILADEMGLGKTYEIMGLLCERPLRTLIVCPLSLLSQWASEITHNIVIDKTGLFINHRINYNKGNILQQGQEASVVITTYGTVVNDIKHNGLINKVQFDRIIIDEGHKIRNGKTLVSRSIIKIADLCTYKWCVSGTPLNNNINDMKTLSRFIGAEPYTTGKWWTLVKKLLVNSENPLDKMSELSQWRTKFILKRTKAKILSLPEIKYITVGCYLDQSQYKLYKKLKRALLARENTQFNMLIKILRLRQVVTHPMLLWSAKKLKQSQRSGTDNYIKQVISQSGKFKAILDIIKNTPKTEKIIIFTQWTKVLDLLAPVIKYCKLKYHRIDGTVSTKCRTSIISRFKTNKRRILLITTGTGGEGLNLTMANNIILIDPLYNPFAEHQAFDRVHRIGQTKTVKIYKLYVENTVECWMSAMQQNKIALGNNIINNQKSDRISAEDLNDLYTTYIHKRPQIKTQTQLKYLS
jgi:SNF2 family DNA or RNA helicase